MCSLDDTLTDLMCHPEDYNKWVNDITESLRCGGGGKGGKLVEGPALRLPVMQMDSSESCCRGGAGHSGAMRLAASLVKDLLRNRNLDRLLGWGPGYGMEESARGARQPVSGGGSQGSGCLPSVGQWSRQRSLRRSVSAVSYRCGPTPVLYIICLLHQHMCRVWNFTLLRRCCCICVVVAPTPEKPELFTVATGTNKLSTWTACMQI